MRHAGNGGETRAKRSQEMKVVAEGAEGGGTAGWLSCRGQVSAKKRVGRWGAELAIVPFRSEILIDGRYLGYAPLKNYLTAGIWVTLL